MRIKSGAAMPSASIDISSEPLLLYPSIKSIASYASDIVLRSIPVEKLETSLLWLSVLLDIIINFKINLDVAL